VGDRLNRRLAKWDAGNQTTMMKHNELAGGTWEEFGERHFPGPRRLLSNDDIGRRRRDGAGERS